MAAAWLLLDGTATIQRPGKLGLGHAHFLGHARQAPGARLALRILNAHNAQLFVMAELDATRGWNRGATGQQHERYDCKPHDHSKALTALDQLFNLLQLISNVPVI
jgi:hypothetical protein